MLVHCCSPACALRSSSTKKTSTTSSRNSTMLSGVRYFTPSTKTPWIIMLRSGWPRQSWCEDSRSTGVLCPTSSMICRPSTKKGIRIYHGKGFLVFNQKYTLKKALVFGAFGGTQKIVLWRTESALFQLFSRSILQGPTSKKVEHYNIGLRWNLGQLKIPSIPSTRFFLKKLAGYWV